MSKEKELVLELILAEYQQMETNRLLLRPIRLEDAEDMYRYASDEEVTKYVFDTHQSLQGTKEVIATYFLPNTLGKYAIVWKETGRMIGTIDINALDKNNKKAEIGYTLAQDFWGKGIMPEAAAKILWLIFNHLKLNVAYAIHDLDNPKSGRVMEKIGMKKVGIFPQHTIVKGKPSDMVFYALTKEDYFKHKEK
ncbi:GNAT family N-acetyltransferase [Vagococcus elongatus]|uniref:GNAT family N-acetyltransferase n=1 Tax=Vagococcus elongatus TaxID=180344 RepID=A0A430B4Z6_9ENTE|nr:GNAT family N-acetyltransferase [Vagococcus elongatus]RSU15282.1 GNAT family N-acetyltransferase [Vagococcus elongatus]